MLKALKNPTYALIGDGKVARHLAHYFQMLSIPFVSWSRNALPAEAAENKVSHCPVALLAISDSSLEPFISENPWLRERKRIHFSGSLSTQLALGFHPLMTFGPDLYDESLYRSIPFVGEAPEIEFRLLFPGLPNPYYRLEAENKPLYHALCVLSGNFSVLLWQKLFQDFETRLGLPRQAALPYLKQVCENLARAPESALTGPLQRKDLGTIQKNLAALEGDPYQAIYQSFAHACGVKTEIKTEAKKEKRAEK